MRRTGRSHSRPSDLIYTNNTFTSTLVTGRRVHRKIFIPGNPRVYVCVCVVCVHVCMCVCVCVVCVWCVCVCVCVWMSGWMLIQMRFIKRMRKRAINPIIFIIMIGLFNDVTFKFKLRHALTRNILILVQSRARKLPSCCMSKMSLQYLFLRRQQTIAMHKIYLKD